MAPYKYITTSGKSSIELVARKYLTLFLLSKSTASYKLAETIVNNLFEIIDDKLLELDENDDEEMDDLLNNENLENTETDLENDL